MMQDFQADAIVEAMFKWVVDEPLTSPERQRSQLSIVANMVCDSASADITCQPLHMAYARAQG